MSKRQNKQSPRAANGPKRLPADTRAVSWLCGLLLAAAVGAAYANSFYGVFLLDDTTLLLESDKFHQLWPPWHLFAGPRPVVDVSLAINYALGELNPFGYHAVNLVVHLFAALTLFGLVRRSLIRLQKHQRIAGATGMAFAGTLIWAVHPLQTQAVTYVIQRSESMMGLFYLLTLYGLVRGVESNRRRVWYGCAVVACALGMGAKAVMVTAPVVALLFDRALLASSWREVFQRRLSFYLALAATWSVLAFTGVVGGIVATSPAADSTVGFGVAKFTPLRYALTQPVVIFHYLRLAFWPHPLCLDYAWPATRNFVQAALPLTGIVLLLAATIWAWIRRPAAGFLGAAFFLILAPTSSFIPIQDVAVEHRMYLSLSAVVLLVVLLVSRFIPTPLPAATLLAVVVFALGFATHERNKRYADAVGMWRDVIAKNPKNARAQNNLAVELLKGADVDQAIEHLDATLKLAPRAAKAHSNMASALEKKGRFEEVVVQYREAIRLEPGYWVTHYNLATCLYRKLSRAEEAIPEYREAQRLAPAQLESYIMLAVLFFEQNRFDESVAENRLAIAAAGPRTDSVILARAHFNLGNALMKQGLAEQAIEAYGMALKANPRHHEAQYGVGVGYAQLGRTTEAVEAYRAALVINPNYSLARRALEEAVGPQPTTAGPGNR